MPMPRKGIVEGGAKHLRHAGFLGHVECLPVLASLGDAREMCQGFKPTPHLNISLSVLKAPELCPIDLLGSSRLSALGISIFIFSHMVLYIALVIPNELELLHRVPSSCW